MKIIEVNKFYYRRGGAESYMIDLEDKLKSEGHEVAVFSMRHPKNRLSPWENYFVSRLSFRESGWLGKLKYPWRLFYSLEAKRKFERLVKDFGPDMIHIHNIYHQISPAILPVAKKYGIPVVMHLHDYKLICPNYQMFDRGRICEDCAAPHYYRCIGSRCVNGSLARSLGATLEMYVHHSLLDIYNKNVNAYIAPSVFMKDICVRHGIPAEKIQVLPNFILSQLDGPAIPEAEEKYACYFGRLSKEKGIDILIKALAESNDQHIRLKIAGEGDERQNLEALAVKLGISDRVDFLGRLEGSGLTNVIDGSAAVVIPSIWFENMPFSALEAMSRGKLVIASKIGGLPELVKDRETGLLFEAGNVKQLGLIFDNLREVKSDKLGAAAQRLVMSFNIDNHYKALMDIFKAYEK